MDATAAISGNGVHPQPTTAALQRHSQRDDSSKHYIDPMPLPANEV